MYISIVGCGCAVWQYAGAQGIDKVTDILKLDHDQNYQQIRTRLRDLADQTYIRIVFGVPVGCSLGGIESGRINGNDIC